MCSLIDTILKIKNIRKLKAKDKGLPKPERDGERERDDQKYDLLYYQGILNPVVKSG